MVKKIVAVIDMTVFGKGDDYFLFSTHNVHYHSSFDNISSRKQVFSYTDLSSSIITVRKDNWLYKTININKSVLDLARIDVKAKDFIKVLKALGTLSKTCQ